jgi:hypothetical protein
MMWIGFIFVCLLGIDANKNDANEKARQEFSREFYKGETVYTDGSRLLVYDKKLNKFIEIGSVEE